VKKASLVLTLVSCLHLLSGCGGASGGGMTQSAATHFSITAQANAVAGTAFKITVTALDASNNTVTTYSGTVHFASSDAQAVLPAPSTLAGGTASFSVTLMTPGTQTITATDAASITGTSNSITVTALATHFSVAVPTNATTGIPFTFTVAALDASNNTVTTYSGTVHFTSSDAQAALPANSILTNGALTFSATLNTLGGQTITATDTATASITGTSGSIAVGTAAPTHLSVNTPGGASPGSAFSFTVSALDAANNVAPTYAGTVHFSSTDAQATLPANSTLTNGTGNFSATLNTLGDQTVTATDTVTASINGTSNTIHVTNLKITSGNPPNGTVGRPYGPANDCVPQGFVLSAGGVIGNSFTFTSSSLPPGLQIGDFPPDLGGGDCHPGPVTWIIYGTPTQAGTFSNVVITVHVGAASASATYTITINAAAAVAAADGTPGPPVNHHHYKLIDLGTFGGPGSFVAIEPGENIINGSGLVVGSADISVLTPEPNCYSPNLNPDCYISHAFRSNGNELKDLGTLSGGNDSFAAAINQAGQIAGLSENDMIDPTTGNPEFHAVLWEHDKIRDLGTLGGTASFSTALNDFGQITGMALNNVPDPYSLLGLGSGLTLTQTRGFIWQNGEMRDLGTLGGPDTWAVFINDRGQIAGTSYTSDDVDPHTGTPPVGVFVWQNGRMKNIGNLGGDNGILSAYNIVNAFNNRGEVTGWMVVAGNHFYHTFLWDGDNLSDLGTLPGGNYSFARGINDAGEVTGLSTLPPDDSLNHGFLWRNGAMTDLGTLNGDPCSDSLSVNSNGQVVGASQSAAGGCAEWTTAFLWENGGPMADLNSLVTSASGAYLNVGIWTNSRGEIVAGGIPPGCDNAETCGHTYVLIPCDENHPGIAGCDYRLVDAATASQARPAPITQPSAPTSAAKLATGETMTRYRTRRRRI
jgi:probable HAF family extracellular repeat protein